MKRNLWHAALLVLPLTALAAGKQESLGFDASESNTNRIVEAATAYIAPENTFLFRMRTPDGTYREFDRSFDRPSLLRSVRGWSARIKGDRITVKSGPKLEGGEATFVFDSGSLVEFSQGELKFSIPEGIERGPTAGRPPYYFGQARRGSAVAKGDKPHSNGRPAVKLDKKVEKVITDKWKSSGRLRWPFNNPNENGFLYGAIALLATALFFAARLPLRVVGAVVFLLSFGAMTATASRGAFLSFAVGMLPVLALRARTVLRSKWFWALAAAAVLLAAGWFATHDAKLLTRGFSKGKVTWSNQVRFDMWKTAPKMMVDAPGGWNFAHVGRAYVDWYQPLPELSLPGSLMNEHLTRLVAYGMFGRFGYLFAWFGGLLLLALAAWRTKSAVPLGVWLMFAIAGWFNPVFLNPFMWVVPCMAAALFLCGRPWRFMKAKSVLLCAGASAVAAAAVIGAAWYLGSGKPERGYGVWAKDGCVYVKSLKPRIWIADDGMALGGVMAGKDIRGYYEFEPDAPGVGYVRDVAALPGDARIKRLVLGGETGDAWLRMISSDASKRENLPEEVVFVSPPFPPSAVPKGLLDRCRVTLVIGEFAARYEAEYDNPPEWVKIVPAMELYMFGWMKLATG